MYVRFFHCKVTPFPHLPYYTLWKEATEHSPCLGSGELSSNSLMGKCLHKLIRILLHKKCVYSMSAFKMLESTGSKYRKRGIERSQRWLPGCCGTSCEMVRIPDLGYTPDPDKCFGKHGSLDASGSNLGSHYQKWVEETLAQKEEHLAPGPKLRVQDAESRHLGQRKETPMSSIWSQS